MNSGTDRLLRTVAALAMAGLLGLAAACSAAGDSGSADPAAQATTATAKTAANKADTTVKGEGMAGGCDAVHKLLVALAGGDKAAAEGLKDKGHTLFDDVAAAEATKDIQLATDAAAMSSMLEFELPGAPVYASELAETYTVDCVKRHGAAALPS